MRLFVSLSRGERNNGQGREAAVKSGITFLLLQRELWLHKFEPAKNNAGQRLERHAGSASVAWKRPKKFAGVESRTGKRGRR